MRKEDHKDKLALSAEKSAEVEICLKRLQQNCISEIINPDLIVNAILKSKESNQPLPFILTLCPAVFNLNFPTNKGQTREIVPIEPGNPRVKSLFEEVFGFQIVLKRDLKVDTEMFIIFADSLEKGSDKMFTNPQDIQSISQASIKSIREIIVNIDQSTDGIFQKLGIKIPKIRMQSGVTQQGGKIGIKRELLINQFETNILDPNSNLFALWTKHLKLARDDAKFTETSWQGLKSAESIWQRMRFLVAELSADGIFLPEIMRGLNKSIVADPIFLASSTRVATLQMEADCFNLVNNRTLVPAFRNIGKWLEPSELSPWIDVLRTV